MCCSLREKITKWTHSLLSERTFTKLNIRNNRKIIQRLWNVNIIFTLYYLNSAYISWLKCILFHLFGEVGNLGWVKFLFRQKIDFHVRNKRNRIDIRFKKNSGYWRIALQGPPNLWQHNFILKLNIFFML